MQNIQVLTLLTLLLHSIVIQGQENTINDTICSELRLLNRERELLPEQFDLLCECLDQKIIKYEDINLLRYENSVKETDTLAPILYKTYMTGPKDDRKYATGYYIVRILSDENIYGINSRFNNSFYANKRIVYIPRNSHDLI